MIFFIFMGATAFSYVFRSLGGEDIIIGFIDHLGLDAWGLLIVLMAVIFFLGFFFDWIEITLIVLPVFAPIVEIMDFGTHVEVRDVIRSEERRVGKGCVSTVRARGAACH